MNQLINMCGEWAIGNHTAPLSGSWRGLPAGAKAGWGAGLRLFPTPDVALR